MSDATAEPTCGLCQEALSSGGERCCGLDMCVACYSGDLRERLRDRGFAIEVETWVSQSSSDDDVDTHHTRVKGSVRTSIQANATFTREQRGDRILRFFGRKELQAGDPLFDDTVWVETETEDQTRRLLAETGLQDVILEAISEFGSVRFTPAEGGCTVVVHSTWTSRQVLPDVHSHQRVVASALHYLQQAGLR
jgi:hypothetical protein